MKYEIIEHSNSKHIYIVKIYETTFIKKKKELEYIFLPLLEVSNRNIILDFRNIEDVSEEVLGYLLILKSQIIDIDSTLIILVKDNSHLKSKLIKIGLYKIISICTSIEECVQKIKWENPLIAEKIKLKFSPHLKFIPAIRNFIGNIAKIKQFDQKTINRIKTIADELCTNAVEHGNWDNTYEDTIRLTLLLSSKKIEFFVHNKITTIKEAKTIQEYIKNASPEQLLNINSNSIRGRGLTIVKMLSDKINVKTLEDRTIIRVVKYKEKEGG